MVAVEHMHWGARDHLKDGVAVVTLRDPREYFANGIGLDEANMLWHRGQHEIGSQLPPVALLTSANSFNCRMYVHGWLALGVIWLLALVSHLAIDLHQSELGASLATDCANGTEVFLVAEIAALQAGAKGSFARIRKVPAVAVVAKRPELRLSLAGAVKLWGKMVA